MKCAIVPCGPIACGQADHHRANDKGGYPEAKDLTEGGGLGKKSHDSLQRLLGSQPWAAAAQRGMVCSASNEWRWSRLRLRRSFPGPSPRTRKGHARNKIGLVVFGREQDEVGEALDHHKCDLAHI